jgi:hypothetical protein
MDEKHGITTLSDFQLEQLLGRAAKHGAREALREVGLGDEHAGNDIHEVRSLLVAWRATKAAIWTQVVKMIVTLLLAAMAGGLAFMAWAYGGGRGS